MVGGLPQELQGQLLWEPWRLVHHLPAVRGEVPGWHTAAAAAVDSLGRLDRISVEGRWQVGEQEWRLYMEGVILSAGVMSIKMNKERETCGRIRKGGRETVHTWLFQCSNAPAIKCSRDRRSSLVMWKVRMRWIFRTGAQDSERKRVFENM